MKVHLHMAARIRDFLSNPRFWRKIFSNIFRAEALAGRCEKWPTQGFVVSRIKRTYVAYFRYFYLKQIHKNWIKRAFMHIHLHEFSWWNAIVFHYLKAQQACFQKEIDSKSAWFCWISQGSMLAERFKIFESSHKVQKTGFGGASARVRP